jgi:hypothetical protein
LKGNTSIGTRSFGVKMLSIACPKSRMAVTNYNCAENVVTCIVLEKCILLLMSTT